MGNRRRTALLPAPDGCLMWGVIGLPAATVMCLMCRPPSHRVQQESQAGLAVICQCVCLRPAPVFPAG